MAGHLGLDDVGCGIVRNEVPAYRLTERAVKDRVNKLAHSGGRSRLLQFRIEFLNLQRAKASQPRTRSMGGEDTRPERSERGGRA